MSSSARPHHALVTLLRWIASIASALILFFFLATLIGKGLGGQAPHLTTWEAVFFGLLGLQLAGLLVAFGREAPGGTP